jgi:hypothetical protein
MGAFKTILMIILSILLIVSLLAFTLLFSFNQLLYPDIYISAFEKNNAYDKIQEAMVQMPQEGFEEIDTKQFIDDKIVNLLAYLRSETDTLDLKVTLDPQNLKQAFEEKIKNLPQCQAGEPSIINNQVKCIPPDMNSSELADQMFEQMPDEKIEFDLAEFFNRDNSLAKAREYISYYKFSFYFSIFLTIIFISIMVFLNKAFPKKGLTWVGICFFITGIFSLVIGLASFGFSETLASNQQFIFMSFMKDIIKPVAWKIITLSIIYFAVAIGLFILAFLVGKFLATIPKKPEKK